MFKLNSGSVGKEFWLHNSMLYRQQYGEPLTQDGTILRRLNGARMVMPVPYAAVTHGVGGSHIGHHLETGLGGTAQLYISQRG